LAVQRGDTTTEVVMMALRKHLAALMSMKDAVSSDVDPVQLIIDLRPNQP